MNLYDVGEIKIVGFTKVEEVNYLLKNKWLILTIENKKIVLGFPRKFY